MINDYVELPSSGNSPLSMWRVTVEDSHLPTYHHKHSAFEVGVVLCGRGIYQTARANYSLEPGDVAVFAANEEHCIVSPKGLSLLNLHFEPGYLLSKGGGLSAEHANVCFVHAASFENRIPAIKAEPLRRQMQTIKEELTNADTEVRLAVRSLVNLLLITLLRRYGYADGITPVHKTSMACITRALLYLDSHLSEPVTLEQVATAAGLSPTYCSALFKEVCGVGPWEYLVAKRVELAAELMMSRPDLNLLDVALQSGFNNTANFNKQFKKYTGVTPRVYRTGRFELTV